MKSRPKRTLMASNSILTVNAGSSSIKFALYQVGEALEQRLHGKVDRGVAICGSGVGACVVANKVDRCTCKLDS